MKDAIIHDTDNDGIMAAAIISNNVPRADLYPIRAYDKAGMKEIVNRVTGGEYRDIYMVDLSASPDLMDALDNGARRDFLWFDHHKSAEKMCGKYEGIFDTTKAACRLVWEWFQDSPMPPTVGLTARYDIFEGQDSPSFSHTVIPFQCYMERVRSVEVYKTMLRHKDIDSALRVGEALWKEEIEAFYKSEYKEMWWPRVPIGSRGEYILITREMRNPGRIAYLLRKEDSLVDFYINQTQKSEGLFTHSIRSVGPEANCLDFIARYDLKGGGHPAAAGFSTTEDLFF